LRAENRKLRMALGESAEEIALSHHAMSTAPQLPQQQSFSHGACAVTIGPRAGMRAGGNGAPPLQQTPNNGQQQIFNNQHGSEVQIGPMAALGQAAAPPRPQASAPTARRMQNGSPVPGGGGMAVFDIGSMRPVPVKSPPAPAAELDDSEQRFANLELGEFNPKAG
jgi:hypothetical protein